MTNQGSEKASRQRAPLRILLVEDHEDTLHLMTRLLSSVGHEVRGATNVADALNAATTENFDWLITDLGLPDGSGLDLMREILAQARQPVRGIALTGSSEPADIDQCLQAGFTRHLSKPVDLILLEQVLREPQ